MASVRRKKEKVVSLFGGMPSVPGQPDQGVVRELRELLKIAESGGMSALAYVYVDSSGTNTNRVGRAYWHEMVAAVALLYHRTMKSADNV